MKISKWSLFLVTSICAFSGCNKGSSGKKTTTTSLPPSTSEPAPYENVYPDYDKHYSGYNFQNQIGNNLQFELHKYLIEKHQTYVTYGNYWFYANTATDLVPGTELNELFYTGKQTARVSHNGQDREHVWACAKSNGLWWRNSQVWEYNIGDRNDKYWGGGSDLFHVRPATGTGINQKRLDAAFYVFSETELSETTQLSDGGPYRCYVDSAANKFQVDPAFRGDIARIVMYMWLHYSLIGDVNVYYSPDYKPVYNIEEAVELSTTHNPNVCGNLLLTDILAYNTVEECYAALKEWNRIDPPSAVEVNRNNYVESIQGNRNPFIDYPQLVDRCLV